MVLKGNSEGKNTSKTVMEMLQTIRPTKVFRIYEDDDWIIDRVGDNIRVSYFKDNHFVDERLITKEELEDSK